MAFALDLGGLTDAELVDRVAVGDPEATAVLWVRLWPVAVSVARHSVPTEEVPGLAAEALVGTLAGLALGATLTSDLVTTLTRSVEELAAGERSRATPALYAGDAIAVSDRLREVFGTLSPEDRRLLWAARVQGQDADELAAALTVTQVEATALAAEALSRLQVGYARRHTALAATGTCVDVHALLGRAAEAATAEPFDGGTWAHLSECAVCTDAFHELAHTSSALGSLLGPDVDPGPLLVAASTDLFPAPEHAPVEVAAAALAEAPVALPPPPEHEIGAGPKRRATHAARAEPVRHRPRRLSRVDRDDRAERAELEETTLADRLRTPALLGALALVVIGVVVATLEHAESHPQPYAASSGSSTSTPTGTPTARPTSTGSTGDRSGATQVRPASRTSAQTSASTPTTAATRAAAPATKAPQTEPTARPTSTAPSPTGSPTTGPTSGPTTGPTTGPTSTPTGGGSLLGGCTTVTHLIGLC
jgi:hypothetical protein